MDRSVLLMVLLFFMARPAMAGVDCPVYVYPTISAIAVLDAPRYNHTLSLPEIGALSTKTNTYGSDQMPVGVTTATQQLGARSEIRFYHMSDGLICAQIDKLELRYGYAGTTVYIASEIPVGSCGYKEVLAHEMRHVAADAYLVDAYLPELARRVSPFLDSLGMIRATTTDVATKEINDRVDAYVQQLNETMATVHNHRQLLIDTPDEYYRLTYVCDGDVAKILAQYRR